MSISFRHVIGAGAVGLSVLAAGAPAASAAERTAGIAAHVYPGESFSQYYGRGYYGRGYYGRRWYGRRGYGGGAVAAGVIGGLAAGALIGGAIAGQPAAGPLPPGTPVGNVYGRDPNAVNYCASRYRSYDPASGTFLANDGYRYPCP